MNDQSHHSRHLIVLILLMLLVLQIAYKIDLFTDSIQYMDVMLVLKADEERDQ